MAGLILVPPVLRWNFGALGNSFEWNGIVTFPGFVGCM